MKKQRTLTGFSVVFFLLLCFPVLFGVWVDRAMPLSGVSAQQEAPTLTWHGIFDGSYQESLGSYLREKLPGRSGLIRLRNQLIYTLFGTTSNSNIVIGNDESLFEPEYLNYWFNVDGAGQMTEEEADELVGKLLALDTLMREHGKKLYLFITPAKTRFFAAQAPDFYQQYDGDTEPHMYDTFTEKLQQTDLLVFDSVQYISELPQGYAYPLWYPTGIHWSRALGSTVAQALNVYLRESSGYDMGQISFSYAPTNTPEAPDADLYSTLNLLLPPGETYYQVTAQVEQAGNEHPNVFVRGGSFMGQSLSYLISAGLFGENLHFENNYYFADGYSRTATISAFDAYDEFTEWQYLADADLLILEVNETKIRTMSWGFIDYLLANPQLLEGV